METHKCNKEGELSEYKTNLKNMTTSMDRIEGKIDAFIKKADDTLVTKERLATTELAVATNKKEIDDLKSSMKWAVLWFIWFIFTQIWTAIINFYQK